jgi:hypothetical protein
MPRRGGMVGTLVFFLPHARKENCIRLEKPVENQGFCPMETQSPMACTMYACRTSTTRSRSISAWRVEPPAQNPRTTPSPLLLRLCPLGSPHAPPPAPPPPVRPRLVASRPSPHYRVAMVPTPSWASSGRAPTRSRHCRGSPSSTRRRLGSGMDRRR